VAQRFQRFEKDTRKLFRVFQLELVRNLHVRLGKEHEARFSGGDPLCKRSGGGQTAVGVIDFHRVQARGVVGQKLGAGEFFGIEPGLPGWVRESRCTAVKFYFSQSLQT